MNTQFDIKYAETYKPITIDWGANQIGFGQLYIYNNPKTNQLVCDSEGMSREFIKAVFNHLIDTAVFSDFQKQQTETIDLSVHEADSLLDFTDKWLNPSSTVQVCETEAIAYFNLESSIEGETRVLEVKYISQDCEIERIECQSRWYKNKTVGTDMIHVKLHKTRIVENTK